MSVITAIGEIGIHTAQGSYVLRPTLRAIAGLGEPREIVELFASVMGPAHRWQVSDALLVLWACAGDVDISDAVGHMDGVQYVPAQAEPDAIVHLARDLLKHGVVGDVKRRPSSGDSKGSAEFDAREHVALAVALLGIPEAAAWDMTMTSLVLALYAKFPVQEGDKVPTLEEYEASRAWFEGVKRRRGARVH